MLLNIIFVVLIWQLSNCFSSENQTIIAEIRAALSIETLAVYDVGHLDQNLMDLLSPDVKGSPHVLITSDIQWELKDFFDKRVLSVIRVSALNNDQVLKIVKHSLNRWHLELALFITSESLEPSHKWLPLFRWCHQNGFFHTLLTDFESSSLLKYDHFKSHQVRTTNLTDFLAHGQHQADLYGFPIRATVGNNPPRALLWYDSEGNLLVSGYHLKSLDIFASYYNASLDFLVLSNLSYYPERECQEYIDSGKVDVCGDGMPMRPGFIISSTEQITNSYLVVPFDKPVEKFLYFLKPFQANVWLLVQGSFLYKMLTLSFIHRVQRKSWNFGINMLIAVVSVLNLPFDLRWMKSWHRRIIEAMLIAVGFMVSTSYLSKLSSILFIRIYSEFITSLEDLESNNISIMVSEFDHYTLSNSAIYPRISHLLMVVDQAILQRNRRDLVPDYAYYGHEDTNLFYLYQQNRMLRLRMKGLKHITINPIYSGIPVRPYWPLEEKLSQHMSHMFESGLPVLQPTKTAEDAIKIGFLQYFPTEFNDVEPLSLQYFEMPAMLLLTGYIMGLISFLLELLINRLQP